MKDKSNKEIIEERAVNNPSYDESLDTAQRLGDFLGAFHLVMNGVVAHNPFTLKNEGKPNEMCDTEDKQRLIEFVELLITQALEQKERVIEKLLEKISHEPYCRCIDSAWTIKDPKCDCGYDDFISNLKSEGK